MQSKYHLLIWNKSFYIFNVKRIVEKKPIEFESIKEKILDDYKLSNWLKKNKDFDFANSTVEDIMKKSKTNLSKSVVTKYLRNLGLTNPKFEPLPKEIQKAIKETRS